MIPNELRISNWISFDGFKYQCDVDEIIWMRDHDEYSYKAIPLTEEWLIKFGFLKEELKTRTYWHNYDIKLIKGYKRDGYPFHLVCNILSVKPIRYVHELQNLHFALTGIELTLKSNGQKET
jgi:hypothetical protein